jgi:hypothetical protein
MRAGAQGIDRMERVPMIRAGNNHDLWFDLLQEFAVIAECLRFVSAQIGDLIGGGFESVRINIAKSHNLATTGRHGFPQNVFAPPTGADHGSPEFLIRPLGKKNRESPGGNQTRGCESEKRASIHKYKRPLFVERCAKSVGSFSKESSRAKIPFQFGFAPVGSPGAVEWL